MMSKFFGRVRVVALVLGCTSHHAPTEAETLRRVTPAVAKQWKHVSSEQLSPNGKWLVYLAASVGGGGSTLVIKSVHGSTERRIELGKSDEAESFSLSPSGRWVAFRRHGSTGKAGTAVVVTALDLETGRSCDFPDVSTFDLLGPTEQIVLISKSSEHSSTASIHRLCGGPAVNLGMVKEVSTNTARDRVAWTDGGQINEMDLRTGVRRTLVSGGDAFEGLTWASTGDAIAAVRKDSTALVAITSLESARPTVHVVTPKDLATFPADFGIVAGLEWRSDRQGLYVPIRKLGHQAKRNGVPGVRLWHGGADYLPADKRRIDDQNRPDWGYIDLTAPRFIRLTNGHLATVERHPSAAKILAYDVGAYDWVNYMQIGVASAAPQRRDYSLVDLKDGTRERILTGHRIWARSGAFVLPQLSPDGRTIVYQDGKGDIIVRSAETGASRNVTAELPTRFYFPENDPKRDWFLKDVHEQGQPRIQGWSTDRAHVLVSDHYDVWALPLGQGSAFNVTGDGRTSNKWYRRVVLDSPVQTRVNGSPNPVDFNLEIYFEWFDLDTGEQGIARWDPDSRRLNQLHSEFADLNYFKARDSKSMFVSRETSIEERAIHKVVAGWKPGTTLTRINPQKNDYLLPAPARYLTYRTESGSERHALLYLPVGYKKGRSYPTIVEIYKRFSPATHDNRPPTSYLFPYLNAGFAVLLPDIVPQLDDPGGAALEDVNAGIDAAVATGAVDPQRLGLMGESFGAFETNFIVTKTNRFKAAVSKAGVSNLWSHCNGAYDEKWPLTPGCQRSQPYLSKPWWEGWNDILRNSPLYHARSIKTPLLLGHGSEDDSVSFAQSVELFNTLRALGNENVVLIEYRGQSHTFDDATYADFDGRVIEFFGHFLKGENAPLWWSNGGSLYEGEVPNLELPGGTTETASVAH
ncbi:prolyl oligopeptidase family serine peptidase [Altererythrobacter soli]|uniref:Prolyl oligopeptidase family serine peptidase n=1 Tax=Croceibacterium soli TaxID=1739690 RepID=A0A6I4UP30_9SPHN|nr:prolyl oligopeptidase family serine peptidase [Croceibacterium soli]MXP40730.1 prolyl oligopeptidase family serine peptidase [Croceibacterium soli]